jgi:hypothetical protein
MRRVSEEPLTRGVPVHWGVEGMAFGVGGGCRVPTQSLCFEG